MKSAKMILVGAVLGISVLLACGGYFYYSYEAGQIRAAKHRELRAITAMKIEEIVQWRKEKIADAAVISKSPFLTRAITLWLAHKNDAGLKSEIVSRLSLGVQQNFYESVLLVSPRGEIILSTNNADSALPPPDSASIHTAVLEKAITFSDLYIGPTDKKVRCDINAPVISAPIVNDASNVIAVLVFHFDPDRFLHPLLNSWPVPAKTAEMQLVRKDGDSVLFLNDLRFIRNGALRLRLPLSRKNAPAVMAVSGYKGIFEGWDYRGVKVLSDLEPVPGTPWAIVAKIDQSEIYDELRYRLAVTAVIVATLFALLWMGGAIFYSSRKRKIYRKLFIKEKELRENLEVFKTTLYSIGDGVMTTDAQGRVIQMNAIAENLTGWKETEARGKPLEEVFDIINEQTRQKVENPAEKVLKEGIIVGLANHTILVSRDGRETPIADSGAPVKTAEGQIFGVVLVFRDQSEEIAKAKTLRESELRFRTVYNNIPAGVAQVSLDFRFQSVNPAFCRMLGYTSEELLGKQIKDITHPDILDENLLRQTQLVQGEIDHYEMEKRFIHKDGRIVLGMLGATLMRDVDGKPLYTLGTVVDITEHRKMEEAAQRAQKLESIGVLAGGIAHDFNNLLGGVFGYIDMARESLDDKDYEQAGKNLLKSIVVFDRTRALTRQLLTFAKGGAPVRKATDLAPLIGNSTRFALSGSNCVCTCDIEDGLWPCNCDENQIGQVIDNIVINAQQAMPMGGTIAVSAKNVRMASRKPGAPAEAENFVEISVMDKGHGIPADLLPKIFDPFFTTKTKGHGLGLATVHSIVNRHDGWIEVESQPGNGATFRVFLPAAASGETAIHHDTQEQSHGRGGRALIMDDQDFMRDAICSMLSGMGYTVAEAKNGQEAVTLFAKARDDGKPFDLTVLDLTVPGGMGGQDAINAIRRMDEKAVVIVASGYGDDPVVAEPRAHGFTAAIVKSFRKQELAEAIKRALGVAG